MSTPSSFSLCYCKNVLYFREGWNYLLELYFWIIIGALLLVSLTIYFARPVRSNTSKYKYNNLEGQIGQIPGGSPSKSEETDTKKSDKEKVDEGLDLSNILEDVFKFDELPEDTVRLSASTIEQLFKDTNYSLSEVRKAHEDLENRKILGPAVLIPDSYI